MKSILTTIILVISSSIIFAQKADDVVGKYHLPNDLDVEIYKQNGKYFGKIIALNGFEEGQTKDINNPEDLRQDDVLIGMIIIKNLVFDKEEKQWNKGKMYGPEKGMTFNLEITEIRKTEIEVVGSKYFFWKTLVWDRL